MIISRTPFRISFSGGGSDFREFYHQEYGAVVSVTINKYVYLSMHPLFNNKGYHLKYFNNEITEDIERIRHPIIKEIFKRFGVYGVDFNSSSDIPSGTGLGSSSSFTVGLLNLCRTYFGLIHNKQMLAEAACNIEIDKLIAPIGKQDQFAAAYGGMNYIRFNSDESVNVEKIKLSENKKTELERSLMLFYIGNSRKTESVLAEQQKNVSLNHPVLKKMVKLAEDLRDELNNDSIHNFGQILSAGWHYKKELSKNITNGAIDFWYKKAIDNGATGAKLLGAGSGGFLLVCVPCDKSIIRANMDLYELPFKFEDSGTSIIYHD